MYSYTMDWIQSDGKRINQEQLKTTKTIEELEEIINYAFYEDEKIDNICSAMIKIDEKEIELVPMKMQTRIKTRIYNNSEDESKMKKEFTINHIKEIFKLIKENKIW